MDGATKIVKGDAIMSLIITAVNFLGARHHNSSRLSHKLAGCVLVQTSVRDSTGNDHTCCRRNQQRRNLNTNQYVIKIKGEEVAKGEILVDYYLALEPPNPEKHIDGIDTIEPAYGIPSKWITMDKKEMAEIYGYTV